jgi:hypothetical protein
MKRITMAERTGTENLGGKNVVVITIIGDKARAITTREVVIIVENMKTVGVITVMITGITIDEITIVGTIIATDIITIVPITEVTTIEMITTALFILAEAVVTKEIETIIEMVHAIHGDLRVLMCEITQEIGIRIVEIMEAVILRETVLIEVITLVAEHQGLPIDGENR